MRVCGRSIRGSSLPGPCTHHGIYVDRHIRCLPCFVIGHLGGTWPADAHVAISSFMVTAGSPTMNVQGVLRGTGVE